MAHVDDLIEARAKQILFARLFKLSRPHRVTSDAVRESRVATAEKRKSSFLIASFRTRQPQFLQNRILLNPVKPQQRQPDHIVHR